MPHDVNGNLLSVGDEVVIRAKVTQVQLGDDYCNLTVHSINGRKPDGQFESFTLNTAVVEKVLNSNVDALEKA